MKFAWDKVGAVLFDWAGTTVDYGSRAPTQVFIEMFRRRGVAITEAEARGPMGMAKHAHIATIAAMPRVEQAWLAEHSRLPDKADIDSIYAEFLPLQKSTLADHCDIIPGVSEVVARLRKLGIKIGSSTGYTRELMDVVVPIAAQRGYAPDVVICSDDVVAGRPAPWMNFRAAEKLGIYPMDRIVVVDDTPIGIAAARNAGMIAIGVTQTGNSIGLSLAEVEAMPTNELNARLAEAEKIFYAAGAHYVLRSAAELMSLE